MNTLAHVFGLVPILLLPAIGCIDMGKTVPTSTPVAQPTLTCTPDSGYIGEAFALTGETFEVPASNNVLVFSGNVEMRADSGTSSVIYASDTHQWTWDTLFVGIMKVQNWDTSVALSGKFITKPFSWGPFTFWISPHNIETASPERMLMRDE